jgi:membrane associated rhomboid family serine protease
MEIEPDSNPYNELGESSNKSRKPKWRGFGRQGRKESDSSLMYHQYHGSERFESEEEEVYIVKQRWGYCSILFSIVQTVVLAIMMIKCGIAPIQVNPMIGPYPDVLSEWGAKNAVLILDYGEWWRLVTPILLHAGVIHLLCNVAVQLETGAFFEREWGSPIWTTIYLVSAVGSSILSVIAMPNSISVGSSGAVMGLFGAKLSEACLRFFERIKSDQDHVAHKVRREQLVACLCSVLIVGLFSFIPYVDWAAHFGGLVSGILVGVPIFALHIENVWWRTLWIIVGFALLIMSFVWSLTYMYSGAIEPAEELSDICGYYKQFFEDYECTCVRG